MTRFQPNRSTHLWVWAIFHKCVKTIWKFTHSYFGNGLCNFLQIWYAVSFSRWQPSQQLWHPSDKRELWMRKNCDFLVLVNIPTYVAHPRFLDSTKMISFVSVSLLCIIPKWASKVAANVELCCKSLFYLWSCKSSVCGIELVPVEVLVQHCRLCAMHRQFKFQCSQLEPPHSMACSTAYMYSHTYATRSSALFIRPVHSNTLRFFILKLHSSGTVLLSTCWWHRISFPLFIGQLIVYT